MTHTDTFATPLSFPHPYMAFMQAEPYQCADDVGYVVTQFMFFEGSPFYPVSMLTSARVSPVHLSADAIEESNEDNLDLIFRMREVRNGYFFEIVLRSNEGTRYGGWLWGHDVGISDEIVGGYRVLVTSGANCRWRFEFCHHSGLYESKQPLPVEKTSPISDFSGAARGS